MVTYDELIELTKMSSKSFELSEDDLIAFVKGGAIRAYKAGAEARDKEDVVADFNAETKELRLSVRKKVVGEVKDSHLECTEQEGKAAAGETATLAISEIETYKAIDAAVAGMRRVIESGWKKENEELIKTKFQEFKDHCLPAKIIKTKANPVIVLLGGVEAILPDHERIQGEELRDGADITVYVKELKDGTDIVVSRTHPALVSHTMRQIIAEVDLGAVEVKAVARLAGNRSRVAVYSKDMGAIERCENKAAQLSEALGGESVDFVEWYSEIKAYIVSSLKVEAREVHIIESEKQALVEVFEESFQSSIDQQGDVVKLAQDLTGYKIEIKLVPKDPGSDLPGV